MNKRKVRCIALPLVTAVVLAGAALVGGCDTPEPLSRADYEKAVVTAYDDVRRAFAATRVESQALLGERVAAAQAALLDAADTLSALNPPAEAEGPNRELVEAWRDYAQDLDSLLASILRRDSDFQHRFNEGVATHPAILRAKEAVEELKENGFQLGMLAHEHGGKAVPIR